MDRQFMNGIVIIAHAPLASALRACVAHVFPDRMQDVQAVDVQADASPEQSLAQARKVIESLNGAPLLLLSDVLGATPCNVAQQLLKGMKNAASQELREARLLVGVNLPMLWRAVNYQHESLDLLTTRALQSGSQSVQEII